MLLAEMAGDPGEKFTPAALSESLKIPKPTVAKILKQLTGAGILMSSRGKNGGYRLGVSPDKLSLAKVLTALEGPFALTECSLGNGICKVENHCRTGKGWQRVNRVLYNGLDQLSLASLVKPARPGESDPTDTLMEAEVN